MKEKLIGKAIGRLVLDHPFWGALALRLKRVETTRVQSMATDGKSLYYNPDWVSTIPFNELMGVIAHEILHCVFQHMTRRGKRNPKKWNQAGDYVINTILLKCGFSLPSDGLIDRDGIYENMSTDHVYSLLPDPPNSESFVILMKNDESGDGQDGDQSDGQGNDGPTWGLVMDAGSNEVELAEEDRKWRVATAQAAQAAKMIGNLPGAIEELVSELNESKVDWRTILRQFIHAVANKSDYTWSRPNRRTIASGLYLPSTHGEEVGEVVVAVDTSGSVSTPELVQFLSEINGIVEDTQPRKLYVLEVDTQVATPVNEYTVNDLPIKDVSMRGRGGTMFSPAFKYVQEHNIDPICFIYLTDMGSHDFGEKPPYPVLWVSTMQNQTHNPFGDYIEIEV